MTKTLVTVRGNLCADPVQRTSRDGSTTYTTFRVGSTPWRVDRSTGSLVQDSSSFFNVTCFRSLSRNVVVSLKKGDPVVVTGTLSVNDWSTDAKSGTSADVVASTVGHDLTCGISAFRRAPKMEADLDEAARRLDGVEGDAGEGAGTQEDAGIGEQEEDALDEPGDASLAARLGDAPERELEPAF